MDELHAIDHIYIHNFAVFSVRLNSQRYEILEAQDCTDPIAPLDLQWKVSLFFTLHISLLVSQNAGNTHLVISRPACCLSYASDKHWPLRNVNFVNTDLWDTAKLHRIMSIAMYDYSLWWRAMTTNKNKSEPSMSLCQDLVDFIPFVSFLEIVDHIMAG